MASRIKVKRILELLGTGISANEMAETYKFSKHSIQAVRTNARELGITHEDVKGKSEDELYGIFFPDKECAQNLYELPDYDVMHKECSRTGEGNVDYRAIMLNKFLLKYFFIFPFEMMHAILDFRRKECSGTGKVRLDE